jgi:alpha-glucoside transport system substrate-binding protein
MRLKRLSTAVLAGSAALALVAGCSSSGDSGTPGSEGPVSSPTGDNSSSSSGGVVVSDQPASKITPATMTGDCEPYGKYGQYTGKTVTIYTSITAPEIDYHIQAIKEFEKCTGIKVTYQPSKEFEAALKTKVDGGNAPDIAIFPQPGLLAEFAASNDLKPASQAVTEEAQKNWVPSWVGYGTVDDLFFAAPLGANLKSLIWYSPKYFKQWGYTVPTTWDDMIKLSDKAVADGHKPWCAGIESGDATGWPATDWLEEVLLRQAGPDVYDQWWKHEIPFNDPKIQAALAEVGKILKNPKYVNAGIGDVKSIATTAFQDGGKPVTTGKCVFHAQANFYAANWPTGTKVAEDGDVFAFYEPTMSDQFGKVTEVGGEFVGAFADRPEVEAVQLYLASGEWATAKAKLNATAHTSGWATANKSVDPSVFVDPIDKLSVQVLTDPAAVARFDASDLMPGSVGAGTLWKQLTQWILGQDDKTTLDNVEASWPK